MSTHCQRMKDSKGTVFELKIHIHMYIYIYKHAHTTHIHIHPHTTHIHTCTSWGRKSQMSSSSKRESHSTALLRTRASTNLAQNTLCGVATRTHTPSHPYEGVIPGASTFSRPDCSTAMCSWHGDHSVCSGDVGTGLTS